MCSALCEAPNIQSDMFPTLKVLIIWLEESHKKTTRAKQLGREALIKVLPEEIGFLVS